MTTGRINQVSTTLVRGRPPRAQHSAQRRALPRPRKLDNSLTTLAAGFKATSGVSLSVTSQSGWVRSKLITLRLAQRGRARESQREGISPRPPRASAPPWVSHSSAAALPEESGGAGARVLTVETPFTALPTNVGHSLRHSQDSTTIQ